MCGVERKVGGGNAFASRVLNAHLPAAPLLQARYQIAKSRATETSSVPSISSTSLIAFDSCAILNAVNAISLIINEHVNCLPNIIIFARFSCFFFCSVSLTSSRFVTEVEMEGHEGTRERPMDGTEAPKNARQRLLETIMDLGGRAYNPDASESSRAQAKREFDSFLQRQARP